MAAREHVGYPPDSAADHSGVDTVVEREKRYKTAPLALENPPQHPVVTLLHTPRRRGPVLETLTDVRREMARVYRGMRHGRIDSQDATRMTYVLTQIAKIIQTAELEARIERLEAAADTTARP